MTSHKSGWKNGFLQAKSFNNPFHIYFDEKSHEGILSDHYSFMSLTQDKILLSTLKKAEDSNDIVFRLYNMDDKNHTTELTFFYEINSIFQINGIEENASKISKKKLKIGHHAIKTFKMR